MLHSKSVRNELSFQSQPSTCENYLASPWSFSYLTFLHTDWIKTEFHRVGSIRLQYLFDVPKHDLNLLEARDPWMVNFAYGISGPAKYIIWAYAGRLTHSSNCQYIGFNQWTVPKNPEIGSNVEKSTHLANKFHFRVNPWSPTLIPQLRKYFSRNSLVAWLRYVHTQNRSFLPQNDLGPMVTKSPNINLAKK